MPLETKLEDNSGSCNKLSILPTTSIILSLKLSLKIFYTVRTPFLEEKNWGNIKGRRPMCRPKSSLPRLCALAPATCLTPFQWNYLDTKLLHSLKDFLTTWHIWSTDPSDSPPFQYQIEPLDPIYQVVFLFGIRAVLMNLWSFNLYLLMASKPFFNILPHCRNRCQYCRLMKCLSVGMRSDCEYKKALLVCWELILNWIWSVGM